MFTNWRPIPSARTVRLLYQLGYITSGTAVGLGTLCVEEQRRRIQILQRVVDNAKIIRAHPRYRGDVAPAVDKEGDAFTAAASLDWMAQSRGQSRSKRRYQDEDVSYTAPTLSSQGSNAQVTPSVPAFEHLEQPSRARVGRRAVHPYQYQGSSHKLVLPHRLPHWCNLRFCRPLRRKLTASMWTAIGHH